MLTGFAGNLGSAKGKIKEYHAQQKSESPSGGENSKQSAIMFSTTSTILSLVVAEFGLFLAKFGLFWLKLDCF